MIRNEITNDSTRSIVLEWSDPAGGSANDCDLFLIGADNLVNAGSASTQDGTQDPIEYIRSSCSPNREGDRLVIVKNAGAEDRYLRLSYAREGLAITTAGHTFGHAASQDAIGVTAVAPLPAFNRKRAVSGINERRSTPMRPPGKCAVFSCQKCAVFDCH